MLIAIVGGRLQGIEACYLARKAGWRILLIDRRPDVPARGLCDEFILTDVCTEKSLHCLFRKADLVLPTLEDRFAIECLSDYASKSGLPLAFDPKAYNISSSKTASDRLFAQLDLPVPTPWPKCGFPIIAKPDLGSGSRGVRIIKNETDIKALAPDKASLDGWVVQEFLDGPLYSMEVLGIPGNYQPILATDLFIDEGYDCMRVEAPSRLSNRLIDEFTEFSVRLAESLNLKGLMDVEAILHNGKLKLIEIDARLPSQTPTAVYQSSGFNMLERLVEIFLGGYRPFVPVLPKKGVIYEHIRFKEGTLRCGGEHLMAEAGPVRQFENFFGADEALSDYVTESSDWRATLIITGYDLRDAWGKRCRVMETIGDLSLSRINSA